MRTRTVRSGLSSGLMWAGGVIVFCGFFTGLFCVAQLVRSQYLGAVVWAVIGLVIMAAGVALFLVARRASARLDARGVSWSTLFGARGFVPWEQVHRVVVPGMHERGDAVLLWLRDGSVVPIAALHKTQAPDDSTGPHPWYLRAGDAVIRAHQQWLSQHVPPGR